MWYNASQIPWILEALLPLHWLHNRRCLLLRWPDRCDAHWCSSHGRRATSNCQPPPGRRVRTAVQTTPCRWTGLTAALQASPVHSFLCPCPPPTCDTNSTLLATNAPCDHNHHRSSSRFDSLNGKWTQSPVMEQQLPAHNQIRVMRPAQTRGTLHTTAFFLGKRPDAEPS